MSEQRSHTTKAWILLLLVALVVGVTWAGTSASRPKVLQITCLDVGEGSCTVVRTPSGKVMVVDCGTSSWRKAESVGEKLAAPYLQSLGADRIDVAVLSHPHADHISGMTGLLQEKPAKAVLDLGTNHASPYYLRFLREVKRSHAKYRVAKRGQTLDMLDGVVVQVLSPDPARNYPDLNERSIVLRIVYRKTAFLLMGDACSDSEEHILDSGTKVRCQALVVGHHGSKSGTSPAWLAAVRPAIAVISCGRGNEYGHPSREVLERLHYSGARVYRTDRSGAVVLTTDGKTISVRAVRTSASRFSR